MSTKRATVVLVGLIAAIIVFWIYWPTYVFQKPEIQKVVETNPHLAAAGQFGDLYGGFTSLLTALTFVGVAYGLYVQALQLRLAKDEAKEERQVRNKETAERQFFQMIQIMESHIVQLDVPPFSGKVALRTICSNALTDGRAFFADSALDLAAKNTRMLAHLRNNVDYHRRTAVPFFDSLDLYLSDLLAQSPNLGRPLAKLLISSLTPDVVTTGALRAACQGSTEGKARWKAFLELAEFDSGLPGGFYPEFIFARLHA